MCCGAGHALLRHVGSRLPAGCRASWRAHPPAQPLLPPHFSSWQVEPGEIPQYALQRELFEELGVEVGSPPPIIAQDVCPEAMLLCLGLRLCDGASGRLGTAWRRPRPEPRGGPTGMNGIVWEISAA